MRLGLGSNRSSATANVTLLHMAPKWFDHWTTWAGYRIRVTRLQQPGTRFLNRVISQLTSLSHKQYEWMRPHFWAACKILWKSVKNCRRNRSRTDLFTDTQTNRQTDRLTDGKKLNWLVGLSNTLDRQSVYYDTFRGQKTQLWANFDIQGAPVPSCLYQYA